MKLTIVGNCVTESNIKIPPSTKVEYLGHIPRGMVKILYKDKEEVIHPTHTKELA